MNGKNKQRARANGGQRGEAKHAELLTEEEVAPLLQVTVRTVERWRLEGVLPYLRMGNAVRFYWPAVVSHLITNFTVCRVRAGGSATANQTSKGENDE